MQKWDAFFAEAAEPTGPGPCLPWPGAVSPKGYGMTKRHGENMAHRAVWKAVHLYIPKGFMVCHTCDNPPCCRLAHLYLGTARDNTGDMMRRGRGIAPTGERNGRCTITDEAVVAMRQLRDEGSTCKDIAADYGVNAATVSRICRGLRRA